MKKTEKLEKIINIKFKNIGILKQALIHRSFLNEADQKINSNERLEFLGDAVLELWTTSNLFRYFPDFPEGRLTTIRSHLVCTETLAEIADSIELGNYLFLSKGEAKENGRKKTSLLADAFEALIGALYIDRGQKTAYRFLDQKLLKKLKSFKNKKNIKNYKTRLQELVQNKVGITPHYEIIKTIGPDHQKKFICGVYFGEKEITQGAGLSKKHAEEAAAQKALTLIQKNDIID